MIRNPSFKTYIKIIFISISIIQLLIFITHIYFSFKKDLELLSVKTKNEFKSIFDFHHVYLSTDILLGEKEIVEHLLQRISIHNNIALTYSLEKVTVKTFPSKYEGNRIIRDSFLIIYGGENLGRLSLTKKFNFSFIDYLVKFEELLFFQCTFLLFSFLLIWKFFNNKIFLPSTQLLEVKDEKETFSLPHNRLIPQEIITIASSLQKAHRNELEFEKTRTTATIAAQVAHDIRSPLSALNAITRELPEVSEEKRLLIRGAVQRIDDIANDLASKKKKDSDAQVGEGRSVVLLSSIIEPVISEKRIEYRNKPGIDIQSNLDVSSYGLFASIASREFKRIISNLINNAIEAAHEHCKITVSVFLSNEDTINICVEDNGKGIPKDILPKLMERGASFGKAKGSGLGLYHAKTTLLSWKGNLAIESEAGIGTRVIITLPKESIPSWFVPELKLTKGQLVVVLDDDMSIHQIWKTRLPKHDIELINFSSPDECILWFNSTQDMMKDKTFTFLCDYEFLNHTIRGLDVIEKLGIGTKSILVTSHYEEDDVQKRCASLAVRLIPKLLAGFVPIKILEKQEIVLKEVDYILIDDDVLLRTTWKITGKKQGKRISTYADTKEFFRDASLYQKDIPIYIDSHLKDGQKGEVISKEIKAQGFTTIYLATGSSPDEFPELPWITKIVGKNPPWFKEEL